MLLQLGYDKRLGFWVLGLQCGGQRILVVENQVEKKLEIDMVAAVDRAVR